MLTSEVTFDNSGSEKDRNANRRKNLRLVKTREISFHKSPTLKASDIKDEALLADEELVLQFIAVCRCNLWYFCFASSY